MTVANGGNKTAEGVLLTVALPTTHTSPTVFVLGELGASDGRCTRSGTRLSCALAALRKGASTTVRFTISLPQSSLPILVSATATTTSAELTTANNTDQESALLLHPLQPVTDGDTAQVEHCTGTGLTSFFECELYPSSISSHDIELRAGGVVAFLNAPSGYWGEWDQDDGDDRLRLEYFEGSSHEATFDGWAVGDDCFEGVTEFYPPGPWVAPYRVCLN